MVKQFLWLAECPVGGQECSDKLWVSIHVICEAFHQLEQRAPLNEWALCAVLIVFKHNVLVGILDGEPDNKHARSMRKISVFILSVYGLMDVDGYEQFSHMRL